MEPGPLDWRTGVADWAAYLLHEGWPLGVGDELRLHALAAQLHTHGIQPATAQEAARWFGPLLTRDADQQQRLPQLLAAWALLQQQPAATPAMPASLARAAQATQAPALRQTLPSWLAAVLGLLVLVGVLAWWIHTPATPDVAPSAANPTATTTPASTAAAPLSITGQRVLAACLGLAPLLCAWAALHLRRRRSAALLRGLAPRDAPRESLALALPRFALFNAQAMRAPVADLRRHRLVDAPWLDGARSAIATVRQGGRVTLVPGKRRVSPDYLLLVDLKGPHDLLGVLAELLVQLLEQGDIRIERYDYLGDPRHLRRIVRRGGHDVVADSTDLESLHAACPDHRLLLLTDATAFADRHGERPRSWVALLQRWNEVALLSPLPPAQWGPRERLLARLGFLLTQATPAGVAQMARVFRDDRAELGRSGASTRQAAAAGAHATGLDQRMAVDPYLWLGDDAPTPLQQRQLLHDIRAVLEPAAWLYLQALAVFPTVHPRLALVLGRMLDDGQGLSVLNEERLAQLCRLPWLRHARLPDWLRLLLVHELALVPADAERVRAAWATLLAPTVGGTPEAPADTLTLEVVRSVDDALPPLVARLLAQVRGEDAHGPRQGQGQGEALLLAFMHREALPTLAAELPGTAPPAAEPPPAAMQALLPGAALLAILAARMLPDFWQDIGAERLALARTLWTVALACGILTLLLWYARERDGAAQGPTPSPGWLERLRSRLRVDGAAADADAAASLRYLPEAASATTLLLVLAAMAWGGVDGYSAGRLALAVWLLCWCVQASGQGALRWAPLVLLLLASWRLPDPLQDSADGFLLSGWTLALLLMVRLAHRHGWPAMRALLALLLPFAVLRLPLGSTVAIGASLSSFVLLVLVTRWVCDKPLRARWMQPQHIDALALLVLLMPLGVLMGVPLLQGLQLLWDPLALCCLAMFLAGLYAAASVRWLGLLAALWVLLFVAALFQWLPLGASAATASGWTGRWVAQYPNAVFSPLMAWALGRLCRTRGAGWPLWVALAIAVLGNGLTLSIGSLVGGNHSRGSPVFHTVVPQLGLVAATLVLARPRIWGSMGLAVALWMATLTLQQPLAQEIAGGVLTLRLGPGVASLAQLQRFIELALVALALGAWLPGPGLQPSASVPPPTPSATVRLRLLDWGRWTWTATGLCLVMLALQNLLPTAAVPAAPPQAEAPAEPANAEGNTTQVPVQAADSPAQAAPPQQQQQQQQQQLPPLQQDTAPKGPTAN